MKRMLVFTATAMLAAVPAVAGLAGNTSLSPSVPVVPPAQAVVIDDHGGLSSRDGRTEVGNDHAVPTATSSPTATPTATPTPSADDSGHHGSEDASGAAASGGGADDGSGHDAGDDHGGHGSDG